MIHDKVMEMNTYLKMNKLQDFNASTIYTQIKQGSSEQEMQRVKEILRRAGSRGKIIDKAILTGLKIPFQEMKALGHKFHLTMRDIEPFVDYQS